jgi:uncharacterized membrane protein YphA (DoxX/SURF4 family)
MKPLLRPVPNIACAIILLQTLFFKFTGAPESVYIFSTLGVEPFGRIASGVVELIAAILLLWTGRGWMGAALAIGIMLGAITSHLFVLGIEVMGDGGLLFFLALTVAALSCYVLVRDRQQVVAFAMGFRSNASRSR